LSPVAVRRTGVSLAGLQQQALSIARQRLAAGILLFVGLVLLLGLRLFDLGAMSDGALSRPVRGAGLPPPRADIVDRNGVPLASTYEAFGLAARPADITGDTAELVRRLAHILPDHEASAIAAALHHPGRFRYIARRIRPDQAQRVRELGEPGLTLEREPDRLYPNLSLAAHLIGTTTIDGEGSAGIERAFNARLTDPERRDQPLVISMDARVQQALESELAAEMERQQAEGAAGVVMDVNTGEVLAMASLPAYNLNQPGGLPGMPEYINRATLGVYELGSTFKPFTVAMALEAGVVPSLATKYSVSGLRVGRHSITDVHRRGGPFTVPEVVIYSSNVATARMAEQMGRETQEAFLRRLGMMDRAAGEILEKGRTLTPPPNNWGLSSVLTVGFGHGIAVTPLHLANAYATLVNGGIHRPATYLRVLPGQQVPGERVFSEEVSRLSNGMLRLAVTEGTGRRADAPGYRVGGKTGTAEKPRPGGGYYKNRNIATFAGAFPMDAPRYVIVIMIDDPRGAQETGFSRGAGAVAAPVFRNVVHRIAPVLGVLPDDTKDMDLSDFTGLYTPRRTR
jgi:cell division protein FtsI (penicillin-binding protein 3)